ncbi:MAG: CapA family protein [Marinobacter sp.]
MKAVTKGFLRLADLIVLIGNSMRIMFLGDINLGEYYASFGQGPGTYPKHSNVFARVRELFGKADLVVGNLEAPLTNHGFNSAEPESAILRGDPRHAKLFLEVGVGVLQVANNHTMQHGNEDFSETIEALEDAGIEAVGLNQQELLKLEIGGQYVNFLAASDAPDNIDQNQNSYQRLETSYVEKARASVGKVDHLFILLHWGLESSTSVMDYERELIRELSDAGVRGIVGSHQHLFYEVWQEGTTVAAPSLGNFVFDLCWYQRLLNSGILDIGLDGDEFDAELHPVTIKANGSLPTPHEATVRVTSPTRLYDLGDDMSGEQGRKLKYLFAKILKGNTKLKATFFIRKIVPFTRPAAGGACHG